METSQNLGSDSCFKEINSKYKAWQSQRRLRKQIEIKVAMKIWEQKKYKRLGY